MRFLRPRIRPIGVMDLKVVKQTLIRYEPGEIAHIENVLQSEIRLREHRRLRQTEEILVREVETGEESEKDLESTERFELKKESEESIKEETNLRAGVNVSASYGFVSVNAYGEYASSTAREQSNRTASSFAKSIVEKSISKVSEKIREERTRRTLEEFEEKNKHEFQNQSGGHIVGIYRWVDKYYRIREFDYGRRLTYEFVIPEPATFYLFARSEQLKEGEVPLYPERPRIMVETDWEDLNSPEQITRENYLTLLDGRRNEGIKAPPLANIKLQGGYVIENTGGDFPVSKLLDAVRIPEGFVAGTITINNMVSRTYAGDALHTIDRGSSFSSSPDGSYYYAVTTGGAGVNEAIKVVATKNEDTKKHVALFEVDCVPMVTTVRKWQIEVYDNAMADYEKRRMDHEEKLAALAARGGIQISGNNPLINRDIERRELKQGCLLTWTGGDVWSLTLAPRWFTPDPEGMPPANYPFLDPWNEVSENRVAVKFFEEAFEWENMTYEFYPYYVGMPEKWVEMLSIQDNDPLFEKFLRAGAACVRVPVKKERTAGVLYFQKTGNFWTGDDDAVPAFDPRDPEGALYNSYIAEIEADDTLEHIDQDVTIDRDDPDTHVVKVPTSLVWLQQDTNLLPDLEGGA